MERCLDLCWFLFFTVNFVFRFYFVCLLCFILFTNYLVPFCKSLQNVNFKINATHDFSLSTFSFIFSFQSFILFVVRRGQNLHILLQVCVFATIISALLIILFDSSGLAFVLISSTRTRPKIKTLP